jgi:hypothetical protein
MIIRAVNPPLGSAIRVTQDGAEPVIKIPQPAGGVMRYLIGAFILFWLGGWYFGFTSVLTELRSGRGGGFLLVWLGAWTVGGIFAVAMLYRIFRPAVPEQLRLGAQSVGYDSGVPPFRPEFNNWNQKQSWASYFPKRTVVTISRRDLHSLRLRETGSGNRLTFDVGSARIDLAQAASEVEREWLFSVLTERYGLPGAGPWSSDATDRRSG